MTAVLSYTLPTMQLVCHLVVTGNSSGNGSDPGYNRPPPTTSTPFLMTTPTSVPTTNSTSPPTTNSTSPPMTTARPLPIGYVAYPEYGAAYKVSNETSTWTEAKNRCIEDGGYLAQLDSYAKIVTVRKQTPSSKLTYVGYELIGTVWRSVKTGLDVSNLPWGPNEPYGNGNCCQIKYSVIALGRYQCTGIGDYVCEIPYPQVPNNRSIIGVPN